MRWITSSFAALLSLLMISTSVSASVCDLSCWLRRAHFDCHTAGSATAGNEMAMSMPMDMDMGSSSGESMTEAGAAITTRDNCPSMSVRMRMTMAMFTHEQKANDRFEFASTIETGSDSMPSHSKTISACTHEPCSQIWSSGSPPSRHQTPASSQYGLAIGFSNPAMTTIDFRQMTVGTSPPGLPGTKPLVTSLRI
jgi:hypothetical protein